MAKKIAKEYYLMHKDIPVCLMELTEGGTLGNYRKNEAALAHFPIGGQMNDMKFHDWWKDRAIPKTRHGAKTALQRLGYSSTNSALVDNLALKVCRTVIGLNLVVKISNGKMLICLQMIS